MSLTPTISDVAKAADASTSAVSFVLNRKADKYRISPTTQVRIRAAITQLGFQPDPVAVGKAHGEHQNPHPIENAPLEPGVDADVPAALESSENPSGTNAAGTSASTLETSPAEDENPLQ